MTYICKVISVYIILYIVIIYLLLLISHFFANK